MVNFSQIINEVKIMFINNYNENFIEPKSKDTRKIKYKIFGYKMRIEDLEKSIKEIIIEKNIHNTNHIYNTIIDINNNILNMINNYNGNGYNFNLYYFIKKFEPQLNIKQFQKKLDKICNRQNPLLLILFPNFKWVDITQNYYPQH
jgi:hypothetical protein